MVDGGRAQGVEEIDLDARCAIYDMIVGDDMAFRIDHEARAGGFDGLIILLRQRGVGRRIGLARIRVLRAASLAG